MRIVNYFPFRYEQRSGHQINQQNTGINQTVTNQPKVKFTQIIPINQSTGNAVCSEADQLPVPVLQLAARLVQQRGLQIQT